MFKVLFLNCLLLALSFISTSVSAVEFNPKLKQPLILTPHISFLLDETKQLTLNDVQHSLNEQFITAKNSDISQGYTDTAVWVRFQISSKSLAPILLELDFPLLDHIEIYRPNDDDSYSRYLSGDNELYNQREINFRNFVFNLGVINKPQTIFLRLTSSDNSLRFPLKLWSYEGLSNYFETSQLIFGIYYGMMFVMLIFSVFLYFITKQRLFLIYSFYLFSFQLLQLTLNGFAYQYLWSSLPSLQSYLPITLYIFMMVTAIMFTQEFLVTKKNIKRAHLVLNGLIILSISSLIYATLFDIASGLKVSISIGIVACLTVMISAYIRLAQNYRPALYFLFALSTFLIGSIIFGLMTLGVIPSHFLTIYSMQLGTLGEILFFSIALGGHIIAVQREKTDAFKLANQVLKHLNETLEERVSERTLELTNSNKKLNELAIKDGLTNLLNHRAIMDELNALFSNSNRHDFSISVAMIDIDHFKQINDQFGHPAGDKVLIEISNCISHFIRDGDIIGRYGGEEFLLLSQHTHLEDAQQLYSRVLSKIKKIKLEELNNKEITASIGAVVSCAKNYSNPAEMIAVADKALYEAKNNGRDQFMIHQEIIETMSD